jgi:hypothetical protein
MNVFLLPGVCRTAEGIRRNGGVLRMARTFDLRKEFVQHFLPVEEICAFDAIKRLPQIEQAKLCGPAQDAERSGNFKAFHSRCDYTFFVIHQE